MSSNKRGRLPSRSNSPTRETHSRSHSRKRGKFSPNPDSHSRKRGNTTSLSHDVSPHMDGPRPTPSDSNRSISPRKRASPIPSSAKGSTSRPRRYSPSPPPVDGPRPNPSDSNRSISPPRNSVIQQHPSISTESASLSESEIITRLLYLASTIKFISDDSVYSFILQGKLDATYCVNGVEVSSFCIKITFVNNNREVQNEYKHIGTIHSNDIYKKAINVSEIGKESIIQRELYDSFRAPFVPRVFASSTFKSKDFTKLFEGLLSRKDKDKVFDANAMQLVTSILTEHVNENPMWDVNIFLMEYMDTPYATLDRCSSKQGGGYDPANCQIGYQHMAANLACAAGVGIVLYDAHNNNGLFNSEENKVVLLDVGDAFNVNNVSDIDKMKEIFEKMIAPVNNELIPNLCTFFGVTKKSALVTAFVGNLKFTDFRKEGSISDIHHSLMMVAFVDFMIHANGEYKPPGIRCRCRYTMESIYGNSSFKDFNTFLTKFRPTLTTGDYNNKLSAVARFITGIITSPGTIKTRCAIQGGKRKNKSKRNPRKTKKYRRIM
jgi:hypothetical protein